MKKTLTANISGLVFHIDEDAYEKLNLYLGNVRRHFTPDEGSDEILSDIESRIAEMLQDKTSAGKQVVTLEDINQIISQLGDPGQIRGEDNPEEPAQGPVYVKTQKRLYRDPDNKYLGGVAGGLGAYFNIDPTWIRILFVIFTFFYGSGPLVYLILWIVVPKARTTAEKLEMRGEQVNISNIEKSIREELNDLKKNIRNFSNETRRNIKKKENRDAVENAVEEVGQAFTSVFGVLFRAIGILLGIAFMFAGIFLLIGLVTSLFWSYPPVLFPFGPVEIYSIRSFLELILSTELLVNLAITGLLLVVGIPLMAIIYAGLRLLFGFESRIRYFGRVSLILWIAGVALTSFLAIDVSRQFSSEGSVSDQMVSEASGWPNLYINLNPEMEYETEELRGIFHSHDEEGVWFSQAQQGNGIVRLRIRPSQTDEVTVTVTRESRGSTRMEARDLAKDVSYDYSMQDSLIVLDPVFTFNMSDGWRDQRVYVEIKVPEEKVVILEPGLRDVMNVRWGSSPKVIGSISNSRPESGSRFSCIYNYNSFPSTIASFINP